MPLVVVCGHPCSGKSRAAAAVLSGLQTLGNPNLGGRDAAVVDEPSLHLHRNSSYRDSRSEKEARGVLKSMVDQTVSKTTFVIFDSLNNIKGYRYELWCIARAAGTRYCVLYCDTPGDTCREWNRTRREAGSPSYDDSIFEDLVCRFEEPEKRNRWDSPLFVASPRDPKSLEETVQEVVRVMTETHEHVATARPTAAELVPTMATSNPSLSATDLLNEIDRATQEIVARITEQQVEHGGRLVLGPGLPPLDTNRLVALSELRRHKRSFVKLVTKSENTRLHSSSAAQRMFIEYLQELLM